MIVILVPYIVTAHQGRTVPVFELSDDDLAQLDVLDSSVQDWIDLLGPPTLTLDDFDDRGQYDPADIDFRIWLGWHDATNRIYGAVEAADDIFWDNPPQAVPPWPEFYRDGSVNVCVDGDHSGGRYLLGVGPDNRHAQMYLATGGVPGSSQHVFFFQGEVSQLYRWSKSPPYADASSGHFGERPAIWTTEFYVTLFDYLENDVDASLPSDLRSGATIGIAIQVYDFDDLGGHYSTFYFGRCFFSADGFVDALLIPQDRSLPLDGGSDPIRRSWARIKAALSMVRPSLVARPAP